MSELKPLTEAETTELLDWVSACQSSYHIDSTPGHRFGGLGSNLQENRESLVEYVNELIAARALPAQAGHVPEASCGECGKKASDGWALYCVACMEEAGLPAQVVPEGYRIVPDWKGYALLGSGQYLINHAANYDPELGAELIITLATEKDREGGRKIGESRPNAEDSPPVQPEEMVIRIGFLNGDALFALEDQLADVRKVLEAAGKAAPQQADAVSPGYALVPVAVLEAAAESLGSFVSDNGWTDLDMQAMDNIDAILAQQKGHNVNS